MARKGKDFYVSMGTWNYAWSTRGRAYDGIGSELGVKEVPAGLKNVVYGANYPKPPNVRISYVDGDVTRSVTRICSPDKIKAVLDGSLRGKSITVDEKSYKIDSIALA